MTTAPPATSSPVSAAPWQRAGRHHRQPARQRARRRTCAGASRQRSRPPRPTARSPAVLIVGAGRNFIAGADIREFGKPPQPPVAARGVQPHRGLQQAGDRRDPRRRARRRARDRAGRALPRWPLPDAKLGLPEVATGPDARRRRHAARAAPDRRAGRTRPDAQRPPRRAPRKRWRWAWWTGSAKATTRWPKAWPMPRTARRQGAGAPHARRARRLADRERAARRDRRCDAPRPRRSARPVLAAMKIVEAVRGRARPSPSTKAWRWSASCSCSASTARSAPA